MVRWLSCRETAGPLVPGLPLTEAWQLAGGGWPGNARLGIDLNDATVGRRAIHEFTSGAAEDVTIRLLVESTVQAPSAVNAQPWTFTIVRDQSRLDRVSRHAKSHVCASTPAGTAAPHFKSMCDVTAVQVVHHAPALILISAGKAGAWPSRRLDARGAYHPGISERRRRHRLLRESRPGFAGAKTVFQRGCPAGIRFGSGQCQVTKDPFHLFRRFGGERQDGARGVP